MTTPPRATPPGPLAAAAERRAREAEADAEAALGRVHGPDGLHAAVLALLWREAGAATPDAWTAATDGIKDAPALRAHAEALSPATRLPWLERLAGRMRSQPLEARRRVLVAARRLMSAHDAVSPLDRLQWLALRVWLGEPSPAQRRAAAAGELADLPPPQLQAVARYAAFLSRVVPGGPAPAGRRWFDAVLAPWRGRPDAAFELPDADGLVTALLGLQSLGWMQRPMLLHAWVDAAVAASSAAAPLDPAAADALRLTGVLLDSPLPPQLARHFREPAADADG